MYPRLLVRRVEEGATEERVIVLQGVVLTPRPYLLTLSPGHGGGWGYSGHSVEAVRFMCDTDVLLGGYGLFGGRGEYVAKIKVIIY